MIDAHATYHHIITQLNASYMHLNFSIHS